MMFDAISDKNSNENVLILDAVSIVSLKILGVLIFSKNSWPSYVILQYLIRFHGRFQD